MRPARSLNSAPAPVTALKKSAERSARSRKLPQREEVFRGDYILGSSATSLRPGSRLVCNSKLQSVRQTNMYLRSDARRHTLLPKWQSLPERPVPALSQLQQFSIAPHQTTSSGSSVQGQA